MSESLNKEQIIKLLPHREPMLLIDELNILKSELTKKLLNHINPILAEYSDKNSISLIVDKKSIVLGKTELDITEKIINLLNEKVKEIKLN